MQREVRRSIISGSIAAPPSAAIAHRAIIAASLGEGQSVISNVPFSQSVLSTIGICNSMGANIVTARGVADVIGGGEISIPPEIDCGESNTALKLFMGILAHLPSGANFTGSGSLLSRSLRPFSAYLDRLSAPTLNPSGSLPLQLRGPIKSEEMVYPVSLGTQLLSGLLLGAPLQPEDTAIGIDGEFAARGCLDATVEIMKKSGVEFGAEENDFYVLPGGQGYKPLGEFDVPASSRLSSYLLLSGALAGKCVVEGLGKHPELEVLLAKFGAFSKQEEGSLTAGAGALEAADIDLSISSPLVPHIMVLSALSKGDSRLSGILHLKPVQRARVRRIAGLLSRMGAKISEIPEGLLVQGGRLHGAELDPQGDAHAAMICSLAALCADGPTQISGAECVDAIYPGFFSDLSSLGAIVR